MGCILLRLVRVARSEGYGMRSSGYPTVTLRLLPQASPGTRKGTDLSKMPVLMLPKVLRTLCFAQDWYLYHVVCLRVLDFFKSRRDFLPNLLRHISTSAIADTFKYFIRLDDLFNKIIMEVRHLYRFFSEGLIF